MTPEQQEELAQEEIEAESLGVARALKDFWASWERTRLSDSKAGRSLLEVALPPLTEAIQKEHETIESGKRPRYWKEMLSVGPDRLAYITIMTILDGYRGSKEDEKFTKYTMLAKRIGEWVKLEYQVDQAEAARRIRHWVAAGHDKNPSRARKRVKPFIQKAWPGRRVTIQLGGALIALAVDHGAGLFKFHGQVMEATRVRLTSKGLRTLAAYRHGAECAIRPKFLPALKPPLAWSGNEGGGYKDFALSLVKRDEDPDIQEALKKADLGVVCEALNALQATPYRINQRLYSVLEEVARLRGPAKVLPYMDIPPMPPRLPKKTTSPEEWKKRQAERYRAGRLRALAARNLVALDARLSIARTLGNRIFYFPHQVDLRGRA
jgi:DNA-directed RNA polymerase